MSHRSTRIPEELVIRQFQHDSDSLDELTQLLHKSYKSLADMGFRFVASYQDKAKTFDRIKNAYCLVAVLDKKIIGTIAYYSPSIKGGTPWYEKGDVASFGQFAVDPDYQQAGIGNLLLSHIEEHATGDGANELGLDTAEGAAHLIRYYTSRGYRFIEYVQWQITNYRSIVLSKSLR